MCPRWTLWRRGREVQLQHDYTYKQFYYHLKSFLPVAVCAHKQLNADHVLSFFQLGLPASFISNCPLVKCFCYSFLHQLICSKRYKVLLLFKGANSLLILNFPTLVHVFSLYSILVLLLCLKVESRMINIKAFRNVINL